MEVVVDFKIPISKEVEETSKEAAGIKILTYKEVAGIKILTSKEVEVEVEVNIIIIIAKMRVTKNFLES